MLNTWLISDNLGSSIYSKFILFDIDGTNSLSEDVMTHLKDILVTSRFDKDFLDRMAKHLEWDQLRDLIAKHLPTNDKMRKGDFGEALTNAILEQFDGYVIPVPKLRFKLTKNQSLPGTDTLAFKVDHDHKIIEVCYVESKLRCAVDYRAAIDAYDQLQDDYSNILPAILQFTVQRLYERNDILFDSFAAYIAARNDTADMDSFRIGLHWENAEWREQVLVNLEGHNIILPNLSLHYVRVNGLLPLIQQLYSELGVTEVSEDD